MRLKQGFNLAKHNSMKIKPDKGARKRDFAVRKIIHTFAFQSNSNNQVKH